MLLRTVRHCAPVLRSQLHLVLLLDMRHHEHVLLLQVLAQCDH